jgi:outer membrane immunogenic protein
MKKLTIGIFFLVVGILAGNAQGTLTKGSKQLNAGLGFSDGGIPFYVGMDYGVGNDFTLGLEGSIRSYNDNYNGNGYNHSIVGFSGNANYHFNRILEIPSNWDFYGGLNLGFYFWSSPSGYLGPNASGFGLGAQVGGRYYFKNNLALNLEFGGGNVFSGGKIGITYIF